MAAIYAHHVLNGSASWEVMPPTVAEMAARMAKVLDAGWPWLIARDGAGEAAGFAYAAQFNPPRRIHRYTCEDSIYLRHDMLGRGLGHTSAGRPYRALRGAGLSARWSLECPVRSPARGALHARAGFVEVARLPGVGRKFGRWLDLVYMQRVLGPGR